MYAEVRCLDVPVYGPVLHLTGICNSAGTLPVAGTYLTKRYDARGGAATRPAGVRVTGVTLRPPTGAASGQVIARLAIGRRRRYRASDHLVSVLLTDADGGTPVSIDYAQNTHDVVGAGGRIAAARVTIPTGTHLPAHLRATVMADAFAIDHRVLERPLR